MFKGVTLSVFAKFTPHPFRVGEFIKQLFALYSANIRYFLKDKKLPCEFSDPEGRKC